MKKLIYVLPFALFLFSCGDSTEEVTEEPLVLETPEDRLGYVLGSLNAQTILDGGARSADLDKDMLIEGFNMNLSAKECTGCPDIMIKLFGPYYQDFDTTYLKEGSKCIGQTTAYSFYKDMQRMGGLASVNLEMVKAGFKHGLHKTDTLIEEKDRRQMVGDFIMELNQIAGDKMLAKAAKISGAQVFENGIVLTTITEGKGGSPSAVDDVQVEYILTNAYGDTIESSFMMKKMNPEAEPIAFNLNGVIAGWTYTFPKLKKGGKYRMYIPWNLAYGEQGGKESLCFYVELLNYGPAGSLAKPQMPMGNPQDMQLR